MRIVTWNCRRATSRSDLWTHFRELNPDVALVQEVCGLPTDIEETYAVAWGQPITRLGKHQVFKSAILVRGRVVQRVAITSSIPWVQVELERFSGNLFGARVAPDHGPSMTIVCVYSPAWPVDRTRLSAVDVTGVRLTQNRDIWITDLLWSALSELRFQPNDHWVIGGDFNMCETFDAWRGGPRGNREHLDRMAALGLTDALRLDRGELTPTFRSLRTLKVTAQLDYLFLTPAFTERLVRCDVGDRERVFEGLSDHLPVVADLRN